MSRCGAGTSRPRSRNHRAIPPFDQPQSCKQPAGAESDDPRPPYAPQPTDSRKMHRCGLRFAIRINFERKIHLWAAAAGHRIDNRPDDPHQKPHPAPSDNRTASRLVQYSILRRQPASSQKPQYQFIRHNRLGNSLVKVTENRQNRPASIREKGFSLCCQQIRGGSGRSLEFVWLVAFPLSLQGRNRSGNLCGQIPQFDCARSFSVAW